MTDMELILGVALLVFTGCAAFGVRLAYLQGKCDRITDDLKRIKNLEDIVNSFIRNELPEADLDEESPGDFVVIRASHMDYEGYRYALRLAKEAVQ
jgi:hypothetical protein